MFEFEKFPEFKDCTPKEQQFLRVYLDPESDDYLNIETATKAAFSITDSNALAYGRQVLSRPRIKVLVEKANIYVVALPTLEEFKRKLWNTIQEPQRDSKITLGALTLYADISGWRVKANAKKTAEEEDDPFATLNDITFGDSHAPTVGKEQENPQP